jgi:hypothetical protein
MLSFLSFLISMSKDCRVQGGTISMATDRHVDNLLYPNIFQNFPVSAILEDTGHCQKYEYCRYRKILGNTGNTSIADTGRFWKILVIPVLQILEDSGKYW